MSSTHPARRRRLGLIGGAAAVGALAITLVATAPASAHVRFDGDSGTATSGSTATIVFRVPTESDTASTVGITVTFPEDTPFGSASVLYKPGWDVTVTKADLPAPVTDSTGKQLTSYVQSVTWTATGGGIPSELYDTFTLRVGAVPDAESIAFPVLQTYSDGSSTDWSEIAQGSTTPDHPAPVLSIEPAATGTDATTSDDDGDGDDAGTTMDMGASGSGDGAATGLGIGGLVAGVLGLLLAVVALVRGGRKASGGQ